jgi:AmmeMemoRadiSam system protein A
MRPAPDDESQADGQLILALARRAVETFVRERRIIKPLSTLPPALDRPAACFVSIKTDGSQLRGCIGTIKPDKNTLAEEIIANAIGAATRDPRFPPVAEAELYNLFYSVDVLDQPEPASFEMLDPKTFGVIVEDASGVYRGLLLPDIEGIDTTEQQVAIAMRKAGLVPGTTVKLYRFRVNRFREKTEPD